MIPDPARTTGRALAQEPYTITIAPTVQQQVNVPRNQKTDAIAPEWMERNVTLVQKTHLTIHPTIHAGCREQTSSFLKDMTELFIATVVGIVTLAIGYINFQPDNKGNIKEGIAQITRLFHNVV